MFIVQINERNRPFLEAIMEEAIPVETYKKLHYVFEPGKPPYIVTQKNAWDILATHNMIPTYLSGWRD